MCAVPSNAPRGTLRRARRLPLICWLDPLHLSRRLLDREIRRRSDRVRGRLLDVGCGREPYRELFKNATFYVGLDRPPDTDPEVGGDGLYLPFPDACFDAVLSNQVLEHVPDPLRLLRETDRVLKPGGLLLLTTPQTWGLHHEPYDFYRYTKYGLRYLAERVGFEVEEIIPTSGLWATWAQRTVDTIVHTYFRRCPRFFTLGAGACLAPVLFSGFVLDLIFGKRGDTLDHLMVARKPERDGRD